jgi:hypothetical protein
MNVLMVPPLTGIKMMKIAHDVIPHHHDSLHALHIKGNFTLTSKNK